MALFDRSSFGNARCGITILSVVIFLVRPFPCAAADSPHTAADLRKCLYEIQRFHAKQSLDPEETNRKQRALELAGSELQPGRKKHGLQGMYDHGDLQNAIRNIRTNPRARAIHDAILRQARFWAALPDSVLYGLLPSPNPRALTPSQYHGCPIHGGNRSTLETSLLHPYQYRCRVGGEWWYNGKAVTNPETGECVTMLDQGQGWVAPSGFPQAGETYYFQAAYRLYLILKLFAVPYGPELANDAAASVDQALQIPGADMAPVRALALAYAWTQDSLYSHKAGVLVNRMAEIYPHLNGSKEGYVVYDEWKDPIRGYVSEASGREQLFLNNFMEIYDLIYEGFSRDSDLADLFARQGSPDQDGDGLYTTRDLTANVECHLFGFALEFLDRTIRLAPGDFLMSSLGSLLRLAGIMESQPLLDRLYQGRNNLPSLMINSFFRDGRWWYDSAGYSSHNAQRVAELAEWLHGRIPAVDQERARRIVSFPLRIDCDGRLPLIGDTGNSRGKHLGQPSSLIHLMAGKMVGHPITLPSETPAAVSDEEIWSLFHASADSLTHPPVSQRSESELFHDAGFAILRSGDQAGNRLHLVLNYGKGTPSHGHMDKLAFNIITFGYDLTADIGYPASWIAGKCRGWETHSLSHATVLIDQQNQTYAPGSLRGYFSGPGIQIIEAEAPRAYPDLRPVYRRGMMVIEKDSLHRYIVDVFRVRGGRCYDYSFHSLANDDGTGLIVAAQNNPLQWTGQPQGTLAHPDSAYGTTAGYGWLTDVRSATSDESILAQWRIGGTATGLVQHMVGEEGTTFVIARGEGEGIIGQSPWDPYLVVRRLDDQNQGRTFVAVYEPFQTKPLIERTKVIKVAIPRSSRTTLAMEIRFIDGEQHTVFIGDDENSALAARDASWRFRGQWGWWNQKTAAFLANGHELTVGKQARLTLPSAVKGTVIGIDRQKGRIDVRPDSRLADGVQWSHRVLLVQHPAYCCRSSYEIAQLQKTGSHLRIDLANPDLLLSRCRIANMVSAAADTVYPDASLAKIENFPWLMDGKLAAQRQSVAGARIMATRPGRLIFPKGSVVNLFRTGDEVEIWDLAIGDRIEIPLSAAGYDRP